MILILKLLYARRVSKIALDDFSNSALALGAHDDYMTSRIVVSSLLYTLIASYFNFILLVSPAFSISAGSSLFSRRRQARRPTSP